MSVSVTYPECFTNWENQKNISELEALLQCEFCNVDKRHLHLIRTVAQTSKCVFGTSAQTTSHHGCKFLADVHVT